MTRTQKRPAFRSIELGVLILILVIVVGLFLSSLCKVYEPSGVAQCQNNLKQIGLAAHNFASINSYLPTGWLGPFPNTSQEASPTTKMQATGCLCLLLPFLEQQNLYAQFVACAPSGDYFKTDVAYTAWYDLPAVNGIDMTTLAKTRIPTFLCPLDKASERTKGCILWQWGPLSSATDGIPQDFYILTTSESGSLGRTNYTGVGGVDQNYYQLGGPGAVSTPGMLYAQYDGIMTNRSRFKLEQLTVENGTSTRLMFGELLGDSDGASKQQIGYSVSWMCGSYPTYSGLPTGDLAYPNGGSQCYWTFGSKHKKFVQFCMADGAVRRIKKGVPPFDTYNCQVEQNPKCMFGYYSRWYGGLDKLDPSFIGE